MGSEDEVEQSNGRTQAHRVIEILELLEELLADKATARDVAELLQTRSADLFRVTRAKSGQRISAPGGPFIFITKIIVRAQSRERAVARWCDTHSIYISDGYYRNKSTITI
jgi:hypothetical protein